jgi:hypothetical protein
MSSDNEEPTPEAGPSTNKPVQAIGSTQYESVSWFFRGSSSTVQLCKGKEVKKRGRPKDPKSAAGQKQARKATEAQQDQQQQPEQLDAGGSADPANAVNPAADLDDELPATRKRRKPDLIRVEEVRKAWQLQAPPRPDAKGRDVKRVWCRACTKLRGKDIIFTDDANTIKTHIGLLRIATGGEEQYVTDCAHARNVERFLQMEHREAIGAIDFQFALKFAIACIALVCDKSSRT